MIKVRRGFSLIELLLAVSVLGLVATALGASTRALAAAWHDGRRETEAAARNAVIAERLVAWLRQTAALAVDGSGTVVSFQIDREGAPRDASLSWTGDELRLAVAGEAERVLARGVTGFQARLETASPGRLLRADWTLMAETGRTRPRSLAVWVRSESP